MELKQSRVEALKKQKTSYSFPQSAGQLYLNLPVPAESRYIRLLDLDPSTYSGNGPASSILTGNLRVASLDTPSSFRALSYVWGENASANSPHHTITCQGCKLKITANCYQALWHIGKQYGAITIWVDSICINQEDIDEKSSQIPLMRDIFSSAESVFIWLGSATEDSDYTMELLAERATLGRRLPLAFLAAVSEEDRTRELRRWKNRAWRDVWSRTKWKKRKLGGNSWEQLLNREWVHRCWTFQEVILATRPIIICGDKVLKWEDLVSAVCCTNKNPHTDALTSALPGNSVVLTQWRIMIELWFNFPRWQPDPRTEDGTRPRTTFKDRLTEHWSTVGELPPGLQILSFAFECMVFLSIVAAWGFAIYKIRVAFNPITSPSYSRPPLVINAFSWIGIAMIWVSAIGFLYWPLTISLSFIDFRFEGWRQTWVVENRNHPAPKEAAILDGIRGALRERRSFLPADRSIGLHGILSACGASPTAPDYSRTVGETFRALFEDLLRWQPSALFLLLDAGGQTHVDRPSWVPNWDGDKPSQWLSSRYRLGLTASATPPKQKLPSFRLSGTELKLSGQAVGSVVIRKFHDNLGCVVSDAVLRTVLIDLKQWLKEVRDRVKKWPIGSSTSYEFPCSFLFAVLEGLSPPQGPIQTEGSSSSDPPTRLPDWKGPYDFSSQKKDFEAFRTLYHIIENMEGENSGLIMIDTDPSCRALLVRVTSNTKALAYLARIAKKISIDKRCLFVLGSGLVGTGPTEIQEGDEVFLIAGVPYPMVLRRNSREEPFRVVGAALVHGVMHGEIWMPNWLTELTLA